MRRTVPFAYSSLGASGAEELLSVEEELDSLLELDVLPELELLVLVLPGVLQPVRMVALARTAAKVDAAIFDVFIFFLLLGMF